ncbi:hypothetical protein ACQUW5_03630 [Legionella sp. CNM-1927-20]|uniref:hypothetical protein n=1 Tax=Legionella sp. CNM-1927-20 TaxID=3422221 RepID=UPI00403AE60C
MTKSRFEFFKQAEPSTGNRSSSVSIGNHRVGQIIEKYSPVLTSQVSALEKVKSRPDQNTPNNELGYQFLHQVIAGLNPTVKEAQHKVVDAVQQTDQKQEVEHSGPSYSR